MVLTNNVELTDKPVQTINVIRMEREYERCYKDTERALRRTDTPNAVGGLL